MGWQLRAAAESVDVATSITWRYGTLRQDCNPATNTCHAKYVLIADTAQGVWKWGQVSLFSLPSPPGSKMLGGGERGLNEGSGAMWASSWGLAAVKSRPSGASDWYVGKSACQNAFYFDLRIFIETNSPIKRNLYMETLGSTGRLPWPCAAAICSTYIVRRMCPAAK